jgi:hypothetical protein
MHLEVFVGAAAKELRAAGPEVGEPGYEATFGPQPRQKASICP